MVRFRGKWKLQSELRIMVKNWFRLKKVLSLWVGIS